MNPEKVNDLEYIYSYAVAVHGDIKRMAAEFPCPELNVAEINARMTVQALKAKLNQVQTPTYTDFEPVIKFVKELNEGPQISELDKPNGETPNP